MVQAPDSGGARCTPPVFKAGRTAMFRVGCLTQVHNTLHAPALEVNTPSPSCVSGITFWNNSAFTKGLRHLAAERAALRESKSSGRGASQRRISPDLGCSSTSRYA